MKKLSEWLAACAPTKPVDACSICSKVPAQCTRFEKGGEIVHDNIPPQVGKLVELLGYLPFWRGEIMRCPECHRPYYYDSEYEFLVGGSEDTVTYRRDPPETLFRDDWFIRYRFGSGDVEWSWPQDYFPHHAIAKLVRRGWMAMHDEGAVSPISSTADLVALGPVGLDDPKRMRHYLSLCARIT